MKINYVIATYNGLNKRSHKCPPPEDVLRCHLSKILELKNSLSQITVMKAQSDDYYKGYYDIDDIVSKSEVPIKVIECENYGFSEGQWLKAFELFKDDFDFYFFIEDDYCPNVANFDNLMTDCYTKKYKDNVGLLCSLVQGSKQYGTRGGYPIHFEGLVVLSLKTLNILYSHEKWKGNPRKYLDLMDSNIDPGYSWIRQKRGYIGGYYQLSFSHLFTLINVEHKNYLDVEYNGHTLQFPYWGDKKNSIGGEIWFYNEGDILRKSYTLKDIYNSPIVPIQLKDISSIKYNTTLKI